MSDQPTGGPADAEYEAIRYAQADGVATVTLNRPDVHNAMNQAMRRELLEVFTRLRTDDTVRAVRAQRVHLGVPDATGRQTPQLIEGSSFTIDCDLAIKALGFDPEDLLDLLREEGFTRLPVYDGDLDRIVGVLHTKDLFHLYARQRVVALVDAIRPHVEVPPDRSLADAMRFLRRERRHLALVREPDGPLLGLVTLEDILEEIVGEIEDEHDEPTDGVRRTTPEPGR